MICDCGYFWTSAIYFSCATTRPKAFVPLFSYTSKNENNLEETLNIYIADYHLKEAVFKPKLVQNFKIGF